MMRMHGRVLSLIPLLAAALLAEAGQADASACADPVAPVQVEQVAVTQLEDLATGGEMAVQQMPSMGRIVRFSEHDTGRIRPAIIIAVLDDSWLDLSIFTEFGASVGYRAEYGEPGKPGTWHWPGADMPEAGSHMEKLLIERVSPWVHVRWMDTNRAQGIVSRKNQSGEELMVLYDQLSEPAKGLARGCVRAVLEDVHAAGYTFVSATDGSVERVE